MHNNKKEITITATIEYDYNLDKIKEIIKENDLIEVEYPIGEKKQKEVLQVIKNFNNEIYVNTYVGKYKLEDFSKRDIKILSVLSYEVFNKEKEVIK